jgi:hypothetical protein
MWPPIADSRSFGRLATRLLKPAAGLLLFGLSLGSLHAGPAVASSKAIRFGKLWDARGRDWTPAIVIVEGDPLADINVVVDKVRWVMKGGAVVVDRRAVAARP